MDPQTLLNQATLPLKLSTNLSAFGLNPEHWEVLPLSLSKAAARHKSSDMILLGSIEAERGLWTQIELYEKEEVFG